MTEFVPINDYGLIGDGQTAALVGPDGSIDWLCVPRFDSPSIFAAILDPDAGGRFRVGPAETISYRHRYLDDTNVLETDFETPTGRCVLKDCMWVTSSDPDPGPSTLLRLVTCSEGTVAVEVEFAPRGEYGATGTELSVTPEGVAGRAGDVHVQLAADVPMQAADGRATARFELQAGQSASFALGWSDVRLPSGAAEVEADIDATEVFWKEVVSGLAYGGGWRDQVIRSYLTLRMLVHQPTGGIVAAPTTSLPEYIGGSRNWDYRYVWLRDAAFVADALVAVGDLEMAEHYFQWLQGICGVHWCDLQILYGIGGETELPEAELAHLRGYRDSRPVRIGNAAAAQIQNDIYGEVLGAGERLVQAGHRLSDEQWRLLMTLADQAKQEWRKPGSGIWEVRSAPAHYVYSKAMCWSALERAARLAEQTGRNEEKVGPWRETAAEIRREVLEEGWSERLQAFVQHYDTTAMDASNLLLVTMDFLPPDDERVRSTVERIRAELGSGPFLRRYLTDDGADGLDGAEGQFLLCSFWLVRVLARMGDLDEARRIFDEVLRVAGPLGLFSEMADSETGEALGNYPQAFTHLGLILAAKECSMALEEQAAGEGARRYEAR